MIRIPTHTHTLANKHLFVCEQVCLCGYSQCKQKGFMREIICNAPQNPFFQFYLEPQLFSSDLGNTVSPSGGVQEATGMGGQGKGESGYLLSNHLESYLSVRLNLYSKRFADVLYKSVRKITVSAFVNSAFVPEYCVRKGEREGEKIKHE